MHLIDSHAHLDLPEFDSDRDAVLERARASDVKTIITIGIGRRECREALRLAERIPFVYATVGIHPHNAGELDLALLDFLEASGRSPRVVALGEMGLDYYRNLSPAEAQRRCFRAQLDLARSLKKPVVVHDRDAHDDTMSILREERAADIGGVLHCFSGDAAMAFACIDLGFSLSIPGTVTFKNAAVVQEVVRRVPLEWLLVETDCPFLTPVPHRGKRNEPAHVRLVAQKIAEIKGISLEEVAAATTANARRVFGLPQG